MPIGGQQYQGVVDPNAPAPPSIPLVPQVQVPLVPQKPKAGDSSAKSKATDGVTMYGLKTCTFVTKSYCNKCKPESFPCKVEGCNVVKSSSGALNNHHGWSSPLNSCMRHAPRPLRDASTCTFTGFVLS